jgi:hypothetical protein
MRPRRRLQTLLHALAPLLAALVAVSACATGGADEGAWPGDADGGASLGEGEGETRASLDRTYQLGAADVACGSASPDYFRYLDDTRCARRTPSNRDRAWRCPNVATSTLATPAGGSASVRYVDDGRPLDVDTDALRGLVPDDVAMSVALVRRVGDRPTFRWLGTPRHATPVQPWSSTKWLAAANAAARLRALTRYRLGLDARTDGVPLGDLVTAIHQYDERRFTSNALSRWFHDVGGRPRARDLVQSWLGRPSTESFGGNYGAPSALLPYVLENDALTIPVTPDSTSGYTNLLSTDALADALRRVALHREIRAGERMPALQWADVETLLYGAARPVWYREGTVGGMQADTAIYVQQAFDVAAMERRSAGRWRVFGKLGYGPSRGGEFVHVAYACLPELDASGAPIPDRGKEFVIATHLPARGDSAAADERLAALYRSVIGRVLDGRLR